MPNYALNDHYESFIRKQLESGRYNNASEVVRAGLRMLEDFEAERENWLREEIPGRLAKLQRNPAKGVPAESVFSRLAPSGDSTSSPNLKFTPRRHAFYTFPHKERRVHDPGKGQRLLVIQAWRLMATARVGS